MEREKRAQEEAERAKAAKKILKVIKKKFACNGTIVEDSEMGDVIQLQGDQRKAIHEFLIDKKEGLEMDAKV
ncbi:Protein translation factor SUI1 1 like protein [Verticillium longisporum]|nr:Protein translation factor SUI1 1 like protein [Verticillium longisporum]